MIENRRVRFATIEGIDRQDLPLAAEVWLDDLRGQSWVTREALKLAALFTRYMSAPNPRWLEINHIERAYQLDAKQVLEAARLMEIYGVVEAYSFTSGTLRVSLNLTLLHRLRVLEARARFAELKAHPRPDVPSFSPEPDDKWIPECTADVRDGAVLEDA